jgi:protein SCO1/2
MILKEKTVFARIAFIIVIAFSIGMGVALVLRQNQEYGGTIQTGKALIGGPFSLTSHEGKPVTGSSFAGKYMLVAFGYTYCPDICPAELQLMTDVMEKLGSDGDKVVPIFITIDPERDTVQQMADYVSNFDPRMVGLTGTEEQIKQAAEAYRVFYAKNDSGGPGNDSYLMDHSTFIYLMDGKGEYVKHFAYGTTSEDMAAAIAKAIDS